MRLMGKTSGQAINVSPERARLYDEIGREDLQPRKKHLPPWRGTWAAYLSGKHSTRSAVLSP
jgi:hypothetical protein